MKIAVSFLGINEDLICNLKKLNQQDIDYFHFDIMDGKFVEYKTRSFKEDKKIAKILNKPYDVHLMVNDLKKYIDWYAKLNPEIITFHLEVGNSEKWISYIKNKNIEVGISIKPNTSIEKLLPFLSKVDLVLVMSVEPGKGGQRFLSLAADRINYLFQYRKQHNLKYLIQVDGGINQKTIKQCQKADIVVVGNFITNSSDYNKQIKLLK